MGCGAGVEVGSTVGVADCAVLTGLVATAVVSGAGVDEATAVAVGDSAVGIAVATCGELVSVGSGSIDGSGVVRP